MYYYILDELQAENDGGMAEGVSRQTLTAESPIPISGQSMWCVW
jgi:hypothetical protein